MNIWVWVFAQAAKRCAHLGHPRTAHQGPLAGHRHRVRRWRRVGDRRFARRVRRGQGVRHRRPRRQAARRGRGRGDEGRHRRWRHARPDHVPADLRGPRRDGRLSVKLDRTVLTNNVDVTVDGGAVTVTTPVFGGNTLVTTSFTGAGPFLAAFRPKSFAAESAGGAAAAVTAAPVPELGATGAAQVTAVHVEASTGPKLDEAAIVVSGGRGLGEAAKYELVESWRSCSRVPRAPRVPSSTPAGCPTATRSARPARS
jgi:hypothetical protein